MYTLYTLGSLCAAHECVHILLKTILTVKIHDVRYKQ